MDCPSPRTPCAPRAEPSEFAGLDSRGSRWFHRQHMADFIFNSFELRQINHPDAASKPILEGETAWITPTPEMPKLVVKGGLEPIRRLVVYLDNGPNNSGTRTQWLKRVVDFARMMGLAPEPTATLSGGPWYGGD